MPPGGTCRSRGSSRQFGWLDFGFPSWVYPVALGVFAALVVLAALFVVRRLGTVRSCLGEIVSFALMAGGLAGIIAFVGYRALLDQSGAFEQARYLLPLLPLYGLLVALAVRGAAAARPSCRSSSSSPSRGSGSSPSC